MRGQDAELRIPAPRAARRRRLLRRRAVRQEGRWRSGLRSRPSTGPGIATTRSSRSSIPRRNSRRRSPTAAHGRGWLYATVDGKIDGADRQVIYPMRRIDCESGEHRNDQAVGRPRSTHWAAPRRDQRSSVSTPRLASASARSLPGWSLWPLTQCQRIRCRAASASSSRHSSAFFTGFRSRGLPAVLLPAVDPGLDAVLHVLRVGVELDVAVALQRFERPDDGGQLHPVVGRRRLAAEELPARGRPRRAARPSRRARDCPCTRRRCRSKTVARPGARHSTRSMHSRACRGAVARPFLRRSHAGVITRMPSTFFVARRK